MVNKNSNYKATQSDWIGIGVRILAQSGYLALNISDLCKEIGASKGSFYWYFKSKRDYELALYFEFERLLNSYYSELSEVSNGKVSDFFHEIYSQVPPLLIRLELAIRDWARNDDEVFKYCKKLDIKRLAWIESILRKYRITNEKDKAVKIFATTIGMSLLPEFIGKNYKSLYKSAIEDIIK
ncbi:TetR/AcrR family transcriptional regulator [Halobacteriovorax sp. HFRX-2_2]|uniref:TetR/AcrR family transcriptional regulator n=1 Tax=unclassified Halobacteriovorax TaxID=2639665 RepID=UPI00371F0AC9